MAWGLALRILPWLLWILSGLVWILFSLLPLFGRLPLLLLRVELLRLWWRRCLPLLWGNLALRWEVLSVLGVLARLRCRLLGKGVRVGAWCRHGL